MDNLTTFIYTYLGHTVLLEDGQDWWALEAYYVDAPDQCSDVAIELWHLEYAPALLELGVQVGKMSQANCVSLVQLAKSGTLRFHRNLMSHTLADSVVSRPHAQCIVGRIL